MVNGTKFWELSETDDVVSNEGNDCQKMLIYSWLFITSCWGNLLNIDNLWLIDCANIK